MYKTTCNYKPKKRGKRKLRVLIFALLFVVIGAVCYYFFVVSPIICSLSEEKVRSLCNSVISTSVEQVMCENNLGYNDLVEVSYSGSEVSLIQTNTVLINKLVRRVTELVQTGMDRLGQEGIDIAVGTFTGIPFLFGLGPSVSMKLVPVGTVTTRFDDQFESLGINHTRHMLNFDVTTNVGMILPAKTQNFETTLQVALCESIIFGKVPQVYLESSAKG